MTSFRVHYSTVDDGTGVADGSGVADETVSPALVAAPIHVARHRRESSALQPPRCSPPPCSPASSMDRRVATPPLIGRALPGRVLLANHDGRSAYVDAAALLSVLSHRPRRDTSPANRVAAGLMPADADACARLIEDARMQLLHLFARQYTWCRAYIKTGEGRCYDPRVVAFGELFERQPRPWLAKFVLDSQRDTFFTPSAGLNTDTWGASRLAGVLVPRERGTLTDEDQRVIDQFVDGLVDACSAYCRDVAGAEVNANASCQRLPIQVIELTVAPTRVPT